MSDTVRRIENEAFCWCRKLEFVKLSRTLEFIGINAFCSCKSLTSIFIPPSCREIGIWAFGYCRKMIILSVPQHTRLGENVIDRTNLLETSPFYGNDHRNDNINYNNNVEEVNDWIKNLNIVNEYELHRACSSYNPMEDIVYGIVRRKGLSNFQFPNAIGIIPMQYLEANPYADIDQHKLIKRYIAEMMGETV